MHPEHVAQENYMTGTLPAKTPLAVPFVPFQENNPPQYNPKIGFVRGTIFPGLDLPFQDNVNNSHPYEGTLLGEIMSLGLALTDLHLYLDTHPNDHETFAIFQYYSKLLAEKKDTYRKEHGPLSLADVTEANHYTWLNDPWPWEYVEMQREEK